MQKNTDKSPAENFPKHLILPQRLERERHGVAYLRQEACQTRVHGLGFWGLESRVQGIRALGLTVSRTDK